MINKREKPMKHDEQERKNQWKKIKHDEKERENNERKR